MNLCGTCGHWKETRCLRLGMAKDTPYSEIRVREDTGVVAYPECWHDGAAVEYETKAWFGCVHHTANEKTRSTGDDKCESSSTSTGR